MSAPEQGGKERGSSLTFRDRPNLSGGVERRFDPHEELPISRILVVKLDNVLFRGRGRSAWRSANQPSAPSKNSTAAISTHHLIRSSHLTIHLKCSMAAVVPASDADRVRPNEEEDSEGGSDARGVEDGRSADKGRQDLLSSSKRRLGVPLTEERSVSLDGFHRRRGR